MNGEIKRVKMAQYSVAQPPDVLKTVGLGSCLGIALYDKRNQIGGLVHIMLPSSKKNIKPAKYADTGIPLLIEEMEKIGAKKWNIEAKLAGGAQMFNVGMNNDNMKIGERNIKATREILKQENIDILGEDVGEDFGRTMEFFTEDGKVVITSYQRDELIL